MFDNEVIAWEVVDDEYMTLHICLKEETAKYLRDWCDAIIMNSGLYKDGETATCDFHKVYETVVIL